MTVSFILEKLKFVAPGSADLDSLLEQDGEPRVLEVCSARVEPAGTVLVPGQTVYLRWSGRLFCTGCGKQTPKLFSGFCWVCFNGLAMADACVMAPQKCHYLSGTCREPAWGRDFCYQPHAVYLSYTGGIKVGITRTHQIPVRWIDQGATLAFVLCVVGSRHQAGVIEEILAQFFSDKTAWARMLALGNALPSSDEWQAARHQVAALRQPLGVLDALNTRVSAPPSRPAAGQVTWYPNAPELTLRYVQACPVPEPKTQAMERGGAVGGVFVGFKGQYLIFQEGVFNVRRHEGYEVALEVM